MCIQGRVPNRFCRRQKIHRTEKRRGVFLKHDPHTSIDTQGPLQIFDPPNRGNDWAATKNIVFFCFNSSPVWFERKWSLRRESENGRRICHQIVPRAIVPKMGVLWVQHMPLPCHSRPEKDGRLPWGHFDIAVRLPLPTSFCFSVSPPFQPLSVRLTETYQISIRESANVLE